MSGRQQRSPGRSWKAAHLGKQSSDDISIQSSLCMWKMTETLQTVSVSRRVFRASELSIGRAEQP